MTEKNIPFVSQITLVVMIFGVVLSGGFLGLSGVVIWIGWAVCVGVLFLGECLFGRRKKRFSANIGAVLADVIMVVGFTVSFILSDPHDSSPFLALSRLEQVLACITFLPPIIVSLAANIGNVIYKLIRGKTDDLNDRLN
ncbi:MAG: hypothetical protein J1F03_08300 [Oscillospiraceae bacterium]|nr:hypothetical protein [Oscillospiraceae bacterium]